MTASRFFSRRLFPATIFPALLLSLALAPQAEAKPVAAILYPGGALVTEQAELRPQAGRIAIRLPAGADEASLTISLSRGGITGRTVTLLPGQAAPAVAALQREEAALQDKIALKRAELSGTMAMRQFWTQPPYSLSAPSVEMANSLMDTFARESQDRLNALAADEARQMAELRKLEERAADIRARASMLGKQNADMRECVLNVDKAGNAPVTVRWSYWLNDARWAPQYRVAANSVTGQVSIRMDAAITQNSGMDWDDVELTLVSSDQLHRVTPPALSSWILGGNPADFVGSARKAMLTADFAARNMSAPQSAPSQDAAGLSWALGRVDVPAASSVTRLVSLHDMEAELSRLVRPRQSRDVWLCASLSEAALDKAPLLPGGQASFLVDGRETARGAFSFGPASQDIFFGVDQLMTATVREVASPAAPAPAEAKTDAQTSIQQWTWNTSILSRHDKPVSVRVEEAAPIARDAAMSIEVSTEPRADFEASRARYVWNLDIPARGQADIVYSVRAAAPQSKD